jgi:hypothetical protein
MFIKAPVFRAYLKLRIPSKRVAKFRIDKTHLVKIATVAEKFRVFAVIIRVASPLGCIGKWHVEYVLDLQKVEYFAIATLGKPD